MCPVTLAVVGLGKSILAVYVAREAWGLGVQTAHRRYRRLPLNAGCACERRDELQREKVFVLVCQPAWGSPADSTHVSEASGPCHKSNGRAGTGVRHD